MFLRVLLVVWVSVVSVLEIVTPTRAATVQGEDGRIVFLATDARILSGASVEQRDTGAQVTLNGVGNGVSWDYKPTRWGMYDVVIGKGHENAEKAEVEFRVEARSFNASAAASGGTIARLYVARSEPFTFTARLKPGSVPVKFGRITLVPAPEGKPIVQQGESIILRAGDAITHSVMMRYEPQTNKNCLGYWVNARDCAEWRFRVTQPGDYAIELWQGCGKGQGGSDVLVEVLERNGGAVLTETRFVVEDTGHFQNFIPRNLGTLKFPKAGEYSLWVKPQRKQAGAIMDISQVVLRR